jgi:hypothetical protein
MNKFNSIYIVLILFCACNFKRNRIDKEGCFHLREDLQLCVKSMNDSIEVVYTTAAGVQDGLTIERLKKDKRILSLNAMKDWKQIGLQYDFHPNGSVKQIKEKYDGKLINWNMHFDEYGDIKTAEYAHSNIETSETGAKFNYSDGSMDIESSMGVIKFHIYDKVFFKVLYPEKTDSIRILLLDHEYDVKWSEKCDQNQVLISKEIFDKIDPVLICTHIFLTIDGKRYFDENFLRYDEMYPPLMKAPNIAIPKYLSEAGK